MQGGRRVARVLYIARPRREPALGDVLQRLARIAPEKLKAIDHLARLALKRAS